MADPKQKFKQLMEIIVEREFSATQQDMFYMEGEEIIDRLFKANSVDSLTQEMVANNSAYGLVSPSMVDVVKAGADFMGVIIAGFSFYLSFKQFKSAEKKTGSTQDSRYQTLERLQLLRDDSIKHGMSDATKQIVAKYEQQIVDFLDTI
jgi:hypothetical protein